MTRYIATRLLEAVPVLWGVTLIVFLLIQLVPGDPVVMMLGPDVEQQDIEAVREAMGLNRPLPIQYLQWLSGVVRGDLGKSLEFKVPVTSLVIERLGKTLILGVAGWVMATTMGLIVGVISAVWPRTLLDRIGMLTALFGYSMPVFWIGIMLILFLSLRVRWFPAGGMYSMRVTEKGLLDLAHHLVLPATSLGIVAMGTMARMTRSCMLDVLGEDYVRTARAKGLKERVVILRHALRNALLPLITIVGLQFGYILGGAVLTETVFSWPGLGRQLFRAISTRDLPLIQGGILLLAVGFVLVNIIVDVLYAYLDPRTRLG